MWLRFKLLNICQALGQHILIPKSRVVLHLLIAVEFVLMCFCNCANAQLEVPKDFFRSPLDIPLNLSGNFGELRTNHFHAGIDIKTQQQEGLKIYAVADGYISRIKVSPFGYGYALYITHNNGYTSVYGHLKKYADKIGTYTKDQQYKIQSFSLDIILQPDELPVTKGEVIALSGNSGGSGGPHLHFELRETLTERIVNPLLFGFDIKDKIPPTVNGIWIVPMSDSATINSNRLAVNYESKNSSGNCVLKNPTPAIVHGNIAFAVHTSDMLDGNSNRCGIYRIEFFVDSLQIYGQRMDRLDFTTNRAMNAHTIYERFKKHKSSIHGSYRLPGNPLDIYDNLVNDGIYNFSDDKIHECNYIITDIMGNKSTVKFKVQSVSKPGAKPKNAKVPLAIWNWEVDNSLETEDVKLNVPAYTLYEDLDLFIEKAPKAAGVLSSRYKIASPYEPVHNAYSLGIKADFVPEKLKSKAVIVRFDPDKNKNTSEGGKWEESWLVAKPTYLGYFSVMIDTVKPTVSSLDFAANMKGRYQFSFSISDGLSGIDQIKPSIDGKWILMEYDAKSNRLTHYFDLSRLSKGKHEFQLEIIDAVGNSKLYKSTFDW